MEMQCHVPLQIWFDVVVRRYYVRQTRATLHHVLRTYNTIFPSNFILNIKTLFVRRNRNSIKVYKFPGRL